MNNKLWFLFIHLRRIGKHKHNCKIIIDFSKANIVDRHMLIEEYYVREIFNLLHVVIKSKAKLFQRIDDDVHEVVDVITVK